VAFKEKHMSETTVSVLVADDVAVMPNAVTHLLGYEPRIRILGHAENFEQTIAMTTALKPDVVLLGLHMPDGDKFEPEFVKRKLATSRVYCTSLSSDYNTDEELKKMATSFGAVAWLDKSEFAKVLIPSILGHDMSLRKNYIPVLLLSYLVQQVAAKINCPHLESSVFDSVATNELWRRRSAERALYRSEASSSDCQLIRSNVSSATK
jgi:CheY-like chemotaxis protein